MLINSQLIFTKTLINNRIILTIEVLGVIFSQGGRGEKNMWNRR